MDSKFNILNKEQENAIELQVTKPHLKELAELNLQIGRQKQSERILKEMGGINLENTTFDKALREGEKWLM